MARRTVTVTDLLGRDHEGHNAWLERIADDQPGPPEIAMAAESRGREYKPGVILLGCRPWPAPGQSRAPAGPELDPPEVAPNRCPVCAGQDMPSSWYCAVCDRPRGSGVNAELNRITRARGLAARAAEASAKVKRRPA